MKTLKTPKARFSSGPARISALIREALWPVNAIAVSAVKAFGGVCFPPVTKTHKAVRGP
jgi:hypothetical protein